jgi:hypothetical protein
MRWIAALALAACLAACSHTSESDPTARTADPEPTITHSEATSTSSTTRWTPLVTLRQLGTFQTRCRGRSRFAVLYRADPLHATETVSLVQDRQARLKRKVDPGQHWVTPFVPVHRQVWRITQGTEPQLVTAVVHIRPSRCPYGIPTTRVEFGTTHFN